MYRNTHVLSVKSMTGQLSLHHEESESLHHEGGMNLASVVVDSKVCYCPIPLLRGVGEVVKLT